MALYVFDGTGQKDDDAAAAGIKDTNPSRFLFAYRGSSTKVENFYAPGVGTEGFFRKLAGMFGGGGGRTRVNDALERLQKNITADPSAPIDVVGFSRGAALALHFVNQIAKGKAKHADGSIPRVRFLGIFDAVPSFGIPLLPWNIGWDLHLPANVDRCCHALALDEQRMHFRLWRPRIVDDETNSKKRLTEVWFRGVHSDIGGNGDGEDPKRGLTSIVLDWMICHAKAAGCTFDQALVKENALLANIETRILDNFDPIETGYRDLRDGDLLHESVRFRKGHHNPKGEFGLVNNAGEDCGFFKSEPMK